MKGIVLSFEAFVAAHARWLLRFATALSGDAALAEDLVQEVLLKVHQRWSKIERLDSPVAYVRRMVVNEHLSWRRKWARIIPMPAPPLADVVDMASAHADRGALLAELRRLPARQGAVLALRYFEGLSDSEIASVLDCRVMTVRACASRALGTLRERSSALIPNEEGSPTS